MKISKEDMIALDESIEHWKEASKARDRYSIDLGGENCALCKIYPLRDGNFGMCNGCPVMRKTKLSKCNGTPYYEARSELFVWEGEVSSTKIAKKKFRKKARKMLRFLQDLKLEARLK